MPRTAPTLPPRGRSPVLPPGAPALLRELAARRDKETAKLDEIRKAHEQKDKDQVYRLVGEFFDI